MMMKIMFYDVDVDVDDDDDVDDDIGGAMITILSASGSSAVHVSTLSSGSSIAQHSGIVAT